MTFRLVDKDWDQALGDARKADISAVRLICPFIQRKPIERLLSHGKPKTLQIITRFSLGDFCDRVSDLRALRLLLDHGASVRGIRNLHTKMYLLGSGHAIVTSANLTDAALQKNHEFGFVAQDPAIVAECLQYFEGLWKRAGADLTRERVSEWEKKIGAYLASGARPSGRSALKDEGVNAGVVAPPPSTNTWAQEAGQAFVKLFGVSHKRLPQGTPVFTEVERSGCHWACTYGKRPRRPRDGAIMFMGRMVREPTDIRIYGRAIGLQHIDGDDEASPADIKVRSWKEQWPYYVRVHHAEFLPGVLGDGVSLYELMGALESDAFASTQRNAKKGRGNTDPRKAYGQQPAIELSPQGLAWVNERLDRAFARHGRMPEAVLDTLDWPKAPARPRGVLA